MKFTYSIIPLLLICSFVHGQKKLIIPEKPEVIRVEGGVFYMGSENGENDEMPIHAVSLNTYSIGKYPVTVGQYKKYCKAIGKKMPDAPDWGWKDKHPMVYVNYNDALLYCDWLGKKFGGVWRLPTEAEWEYAAKAGTLNSTFLYCGSNEIYKVGWYAENSLGKTQHVGLKAPNELGIYDMSGNIYEWCSDWYEPYYVASDSIKGEESKLTNRVLRGGSWDSTEDYCTVTHRCGIFNPIRRDIRFGFRVVLEQ